MQILGKIVSVIGAAFVGLSAFAVLKKPATVYEDDPSQKNPMEGKKVIFVEDEGDPMTADGICGHLEVVGDSCRNRSFYEKNMKRLLDLIFSFFGLVILFPLFLLLSLAVYIDDPGPIFFKQKRVGLNKQYFAIHKFRSMKMSTPRDVPTHMLENPEQYITRVGRLLRKYSLDELPQISDIFIGNMSVVGPRPALWNQDVLTAERDKYGANDVVPGLTGWAQVNGRDELEIPEKARYDGDYCRNLTFKMDATCFFMTIANMLKGKGVVEGGTGVIEKHIKKRKQEIDKNKVGSK